MNQQFFYRVLQILLALVWVLNGLFCKVLDFVPRHQQIVGRILGTVYQKPLTIGIGIAETLMAVWILTGFRSRISAIFQIIMVLVMNVIEFIVVPDLLLWGHLNLFFAICFAGLVYLNEFYVNPKSRG